MNFIIRKKTIYLITFIIFISSRSLFCENSSNQCIEYFETVKSLRKDLLSNNDLEKIKLIKSDNKIKINEKITQIFEIILNARLRKVKPTDALKIKEIVSLSKVINSNSISGIVKRKSNQIIIDVPEEFKNSIIYYFILTHELEHVLQNVLAKKGLYKILPSLKNIFKSAKTLGLIRYKNEEGAMILEWYYLNNIPKELRNEIIERIKIDNALEKEDREFVIRVLNNSDLSLNEYLENERKSGRYYKKFHEAQGEIEATFRNMKILDSGAILFFSIGGYTFSCIWLSKNFNLKIKYLCYPVNKLMFNKNH